MAEKLPRGLKAEIRNGHTYYKAQLAVPEALRGVVGKKTLSRYIGAVTRTNAIRELPRKIVEMESEIAGAVQAAKDVSLKSKLADEWDENEFLLEASLPEIIPDLEKAHGGKFKALGIDKPTGTQLLEAERQELASGYKRKIHHVSAEDGVDPNSVWGMYQTWLDIKLSEGRNTRSTAENEKARRKIAEQFCEFVGKETPFAAITTKHVLEFKTRLLKDKITHRTVDNKLNKISGCFKRLRPGTIDPFEGFTSKKEVYENQEKKKGDFSDEQVLKMIDASRKQSEAFHWYIMLAAYTGARKSELVWLEKDDFDFDTNVVKFNYDKEFTGKTPGAKRQVPLHQKLKGIDKYVQSCGKRVFPFSKSSVDRWFKEIQKEADAFGTKIDGENHTLSFHSFRHCVETRLLNADVSIDRVNIIIGHSRTALAKRYGARVDLESLRKAIKKLEYKS